MTLHEFKNLKTDDIIEVITDRLYCSPIKYYQYRAHNSETYPIYTLFKVIKNIGDQRNSLGTNIIIDNCCIPNTGGNFGCTWFSSDTARHFRLCTSSIDNNIVY